MNLPESTSHPYLAKCSPIVSRMRWLRVGEKVWRDFWALLRVIHYSRYVLFYFGRGGSFAFIGWILWSGTYVYIFRPEAKCSALSYKTLLGTGRNGSERRLLVMKKHMIVVFLLAHRLQRCGERWARGGFFFLVLIELDRWDDQLWNGLLYLLLNRLILVVLSYYSFFFSSRCSIHFCSCSFLAVIALVPTICCYLLGTPSALMSTEIDNSIDLLLPVSPSIINFCLWPFFTLRFKRPLSGWPTNLILQNVHCKNA